MSPNDNPPRELVVTLTALTVTGGFLDAVSYLGLGHVFTCNMTGNIVLIGFAAVGAPGLSFTASLCALACFLVGAAIGGRLARRVSSLPTMLLGEMVAEAALVGCAAVVAATVSVVGTGWPRFTIIGLLSFAMGLRNVSVRRMGVDGMTTTVMTTTLTGLAADSVLGGSSNPNTGRRATSVVAMFGGALVGATFLLHVSAAAALGVAAVVDVASAIYYGRQAPLQLGAAR